MCFRRGLEGVLKHSSDAVWPILCFKGGWGRWLKHGIEESGGLLCFNGGDVVVRGLAGAVYAMRRLKKSGNRAPPALTTKRAGCG